MTNQRRPMTALRVRDLDASIGVYVGQVGCTLIDRPDGADVATVEHAGYRLLLAGPSAGDLVPHLHDVHEVAKPGATVFFNGGPAELIDDLRVRLESHGMNGLTTRVRWWGDQTLLAADPDGYTICFWTTIDRAPEETLALYEQGPDRLERALEGLSGADLDCSEAASEWTIRQIVHHLTDSEATVLDRTKMGLAEPGRTYHPNSYLQDLWAERLDYAGRDIAPAVALFRAIRGHMSQLMRHLPDAWERSTRNPDGHEMTAGTMIAMLMSHAYEHIETIHEIRQSRVQ
jgi:catechol 2,3-dioxygenase-like lactoylglutathione lyase family enzyme